MPFLIELTHLEVTRASCMSKAHPKETLRTQNAAQFKGTPLETIGQCLRRVGQQLQQRDVTEVQSKGALDVVSALDLWAEEEIVTFLRQHFPEDEILSEERSNVVNYAERIWVLDPLDGTVNRTSEIPFYCISLALLERGAPSVALVYDPVHDELFTAQHGGGAYCNGKAIRVNTEGVRGISITSAVLRALVENEAERLIDLYKNVGKLRNLGAQALQLCYVACGRLAACASLETKLWDNLAGALIAAEAGAQVSKHDGSPLFPIEAHSPCLRGAADPCLAAAPHVHAQLVETLRRL